MLFNSVFFHLLHLLHLFYPNFYPFLDAINILSYLILISEFGSEFVEL